MHLNLNAFKLCILHIARTPQLTEVDMSTAIFFNNNPPTFSINIEQIGFDSRTGGLLIWLTKARRV